MHALLSTRSVKKATSLASVALGWDRLVSIGNIVNCGTIMTAGHQEAACVALTLDCLINLLLDSNPSFD